MPLSLSAPRRQAGGEAETEFVQKGTKSKAGLGKGRIQMAGEPEQAPQDRLGDGPSEPRTSDGAAGGFGLVGIGFEFLATICLLGAVGWWADRRWNTFPWLMIAGGAVGFAAGLAMIVRAGKSAFKD